jgi:hypothetical protein
MFRKPKNKNTTVFLVKMQEIEVAYIEVSFADARFINVKIYGNAVLANKHQAYSKELSTPK